MSRATETKIELGDPAWWICVIFLVLSAMFAVWNAVLGNWLSLASNGCNGVLWWRGLHTPPVYWDNRAFWRWWPASMVLAIAGVF